jgi:hypothetical protein
MHALLSGSPALDAGHSGGLSTDQRGGARAVLSTTNTPPSDGSDIGAFEAGGYVRLASITRRNSTAHLEFTKDATTGPVPVYHVQRRAAFGVGDWENLLPDPHRHHQRPRPLPRPYRNERAELLPRARGAVAVEFFELFEPSSRFRRLRAADAVVAFSPW